MSALLLPPPVTIEDGDLLRPIGGHLSVKPLDGDPILSQERIGVVPSTQPSSVSAVVQAFEQRAKEDIPPPPECAPPPPPFSYPPADQKPPGEGSPYAVPKHPRCGEEEEEDIYQKIGKEWLGGGLLDDGEDDGLINDFEEEADENFTVHFAHHGRKAAGKSNFSWNTKKKY